MKYIHTWNTSQPLTRIKRGDQISVLANLKNIMLSNNSKTTEGYMPNHATCGVGLHAK